MLWAALLIFVEFVDIYLAVASPLFLVRIRVSLFYHLLLNSSLLVYFVFIIFWVPSSSAVTLLNYFIGLLFFHVQSVPFYLLKSHRRRLHAATVV